MKDKVFRYSESFKRKVVEEYESGERITDLKIKYGIKGSMTVSNWIQKYSKKGFRHEMVHIQTEEDINYVKGLEKKVEMMEKVIGRMTLERIKKMLDVSSKIKIDIMRDVLELEENLFNKKLFDWAAQFGFTIDGDYLIINQDSIKYREEVVMKLLVKYMLHMR